MNRSRVLVGSTYAHRGRRPPTSHADHVGILDVRGRNVLFHFIGDAVRPRRVADVTDEATQVTQWIAALIASAHRHPMPTH